MLKILIEKEGSISLTVSLVNKSQEIKQSKMHFKII